jgi:hypothetical protein
VEVALEDQESGIEATKRGYRLIAYYFESRRSEYVMALVILPDRSLPASMSVRKFENSGFSYRRQIVIVASLCFWTVISWSSVSPY